MDSNELEYMDFDAVTVELDDGGTMECDIDCIFPVDDKLFVALIPLKDGEPVEDDLVIYHFEKLEDGQAAIYAIEDEVLKIKAEEAYAQYLEFFLSSEDFEEDYEDVGVLDGLDEESEEA